MENFINKIGKKATDTYSEACKATGKFTKEMKLKSKMSENKRKIEELYEDIGKIVYEKYLLKEEIHIDTDLLKNCSEVDNLAEETEKFRMELLELKDLKQCPKCHYEIYHDFNFCPNCGYKQEEVKKETKEENNGENKIEDEQ